MQVQLTSGHSCIGVHMKTPNYYPCLPNTPSISLIYLLNFIMTTLCSSVIIVIVHKNTNYYCYNNSYFHYARTIIDNNSIYDIYISSIYYYILAQISSLNIIQTLYNNPYYIVIQYIPTYLYPL